MGFFLTRLKLITTCAFELARFGLPEQTGQMDREVVFIVDGVGGFQAAPLMVRRALRAEGSELGTVLFTWHYGLPGEIWTDLMWHRRNRLMGAKLARRLQAFRRRRQGTVIHLLAVSAGAGIAVFACEQLSRIQCRRNRGGGPQDPDGAPPVIETLILACPAISPTYNLAPALRAVKRCYALVSHRDTFILGLGTRIFGTVDRRFAPAAGLAGFRLPPDLSHKDADAYRRLAEIRWAPTLRREGHDGGHAGWIAVPLLRRHLLDILRGDPRLPAHPLKPGGEPA